MAVGRWSALDRAVQDSMTDYALAGHESRATTDGIDAVDQLDYTQKVGKRAIYESYSFHPRGASTVDVTNESHGDDADEEHRYTVDVVDGVPARCECPADEFHDGACKHRVALALAEPVLATVTIDGEAVATDGGTEIVTAGDGAEILDEDDGQDDGRPDDCDCVDWHSDVDLPCWPCYRDGFETPAETEGEG